MFNEKGFNCMQARMPQFHTIKCHQSNIGTRISMQCMHVALNNKSEKFNWIRSTSISSSRVTWSPSKTEVIVPLFDYQQKFVRWHSSIDTEEKWDRLGEAKLMNYRAEWITQGGKGRQWRGGGGGSGAHSQNKLVKPGRSRGPKERGKVLDLGGQDGTQKRRQRTAQHPKLPLLLAVCNCDGVLQAC